MANSLDAFSPEYWSARIQILLKQTLVSRAIANFEERALLTNGVQVHRPYMSDVQVNTYTKGTDVTPQDITATDEYLVVDQTKEATVYIDEVDVAQNKYSVANSYADRMGYQLKKEMDSAFLNEVASATLTMDASDFGGTALAGYEVTPSNVIGFFAKANAKMNNQNIEDTKDWFAIITPNVEAVIQQSFIYNGFQKADAGLLGMGRGNGLMGKYLNFNIFSSTQVKHVNTFTTSAILVAAETVTIAGVAFTACANGAASGAGGFSISTTEDLCMANLVAAINGTGTPGVTTYIALSDANRRTLKNARVVASYAAHVLTITSAGPVTTAETSTVGAWGTQVAHCWFGQYGCTDMVIQRDVQIQKNKAPLKTGYNWILWTLYGIKSFQEGKDRALRALVKA